MSFTSARRCTCGIRLRSGQKEYCSVKHLNVNRKNVIFQKVYALLDSDKYFTPREICRTLNLKRRQVSNFVYYHFRIGRLERVPASKKGASRPHAYRLKSGAKQE